MAITRAPGSLISLEDLQGYRAIVRAPLASSYRGFQIETMPPPSAGGVALTEMLGLFEQLAAHQVKGARARLLLSSIAQQSGA